MELQLPSQSLWGHFLIGYLLYYILSPLVGLWPPRDSQVDQLPPMCMSESSLQSLHLHPWPDRSSRSWGSASVIRTRGPGWPQPSCGADPDNWPTVSYPLLAWILPSYPHHLHLSSPEIKACQASILWGLHPPSVLHDSFTLESVDSEKHMLGWVTSLRPYSLVHRCLEDFFSAWPCYLCDCFFSFLFLLWNSMIYSLWHKNPKKMQFQHFPSWCEKMLKQPKKWLVIPRGSWGSFALEIQSEAEDGSGGGYCVWHPCSQSKISHLFFICSPLSFLLLPFPPLRWSIYGKLTLPSILSELHKDILLGESRDSSFSI